MEPFKRNKSTSRDVVARSAASRPNIFYPEIHGVALWQVYDQDLYKLDTKNIMVNQNDKGHKDIVKLDSHYGQSVHENRPQITIGVTEQRDRVVENVDVD